MEQGKLTYLKVDALKASPWNRSEDGNGEMKDLVESIKLHGILQPLIIRHNSEIVAGHRRWRAAKAAGLKEVPCIFKALSDQDAKVTQITENLQRKNLNAMEEARAFQTLNEANAHTPQTISEIVGKDVKYVYRSLELLRLDPKAQKAIESGALTGAHGHQLVRVGGKQTDTILRYALTKDYHGNCPTVEDLKNFIRQKVGKRLSAAPWDKGIEYASKVACKGCPYNSGNQESLFDGAEDGQCTNGACYNTKLNQWYKDLRAKGEKRWPTLKFIGTATARYGNTQVIKGYQVVEESAGVKKAVANVPDGDPDYKTKGYGFGILKPSNWGTLKATKLVVLKKVAAGMKPEQEGYQRDPDEEYRWQFIRMYQDQHGKGLQALESKCETMRIKLRMEADAAWKKNKKGIIAEFKKQEEKSK